MLLAKLAAETDYYQRERRDVSDHMNQVKRKAAAKRELKEAEDNRRLREDSNRLRDELAAMTVQYNGIAELYEELKASFEKVREQNRKAKEAAKKRRAWNDTLSYHLMIHRKFIGDQIGYPPAIRGDVMTELDHGVLEYYLRPYAHFAPQILIPDEMYTVDRMCLLCGIMIPHSRAVIRQMQRVRPQCMVLFDTVPANSLAYPSCRPYSVRPWRPASRRYWICLIIVGAAVGGASPR